MPRTHRRNTTNTASRKDKEIPKGGQQCGLPRTFNKLKRQREEFLKSECICDDRAETRGQTRSSRTRSSSQLKQADLSATQTSLSGNDKPGQHVSTAIDNLNEPTILGSTRSDNTSVKIVQIKRAENSRFKKCMRCKKRIKTDKSALSDTEDTDDGQLIQGISEIIAKQAIENVCIDTPNDTWSRNISGMAVLSNFDIVIVDYDNKCVKILGFNKHAIIAVKYFGSSPPFDGTVLEDDLIAVTIPNEKRITFLFKSGKDELETSRERQIMVNHRCFGIAYIVSNKTFIVTMSDNESVDIIDLDGNTLTSLKNMPYYLGETFLAFPYYVIPVPNMDAVYVANGNSNHVVENHSAIICMTYDGDVIAVYADDDLSAPKMTLGNDGNLYLCGYNSRNIHHVTLNRDAEMFVRQRKIRVGIKCQNICGLTYDKRNKKLYLANKQVSQDGKDGIKEIDFVTTIIP